MSHEQEPPAEVGAKVISLNDRIKQRGEAVLHAFDNVPEGYGPGDNEALDAVLALDDIAESAGKIIDGLLDLQRLRRTPYSGPQSAVDTALRVAKETIDTMIARNEMHSVDLEQQD